MESNLGRALALTILLISSAFSAHGHAADIHYQITWVGSGGYTMTGGFSFDSSLQGELIKETDLDTMSIEGFLNGVSIGTFSGTPYAFNFDSATGLFPRDRGAGCNLTTGQVWGGGSCIGDPEEFGFLRASIYEALRPDKITLLGQILVDDSTLTASLVPIPTAAWLFLTALGGLGIIKRKQHDMR